MTRKNRKVPQKWGAENVKYATSIGGMGPPIIYRIFGQPIDGADEL